MKNDGGMPRRWPIGVSVVGQWGTDSVVMAVGKALEVMQEKERESDDFSLP